VKLFKDILELFTLNEEFNISMNKHIATNEAKHIAFIFDGFDEYSSSLYRGNHLLQM